MLTLPHLFQHLDHWEVIQGAVPEASDVQERHLCMHEQPLLVREASHTEGLAFRTQVLLVVPRMPTICTHFLNRLLCYCAGEERKREAKQ